jgi:ketosteroid isomerase-like protein
MVNEYRTDQMIPVAVALIWVVFATGPERAQGIEPKPGRYQQLTLPVEERVPGVDLKSYTLITDSPEADRREAAAIIQVQISWPRAMQTKDAALFDRILSRQFTFREPDGTFYGRDAYIRDRVARPETVASARYENVVLQIFREIAVLSCRNVVAGTDAGGKRETWHLSWAGVFAREDGQWKVRASHLVSERVEKEM